MAIQHQKTFLGYRYRYADLVLFSVRKTEFAALLATVATKTLVEIQTMTTEGSSFMNKISYLDSLLSDSGGGLGGWSSVITALTDAHDSEVVGDARTALTAALTLAPDILDEMAGTWTNGGAALASFSLMGIYSVQGIKFSPEASGTFIGQLLNLAFLDGFYTGGRIPLSSQVIDIIETTSGVTNLTDAGHSVSGDVVEIEFTRLISWAIENKDYSPEDEE